MNSVLKQYPNSKIYVILYGKLKTLIGVKMDEVTMNDIISQSTYLDAWYDKKVKYQLLVQAEEFQEKNSGWFLFEIIKLVNINNSLFKLDYQYTTIYQRIFNQKRQWLIFKKMILIVLCVQSGHHSIPKKIMHA